MADERNVAHDKKVAADKDKAAGGGVGKDSAANVDGDGAYIHFSRSRKMSCNLLRRQADCSTLPADRPSLHRMTSTPPTTGAIPTGRRVSRQQTMRLRPGGSAE